MEQSSVVGRLSCWGIGINRLYHIGRHWYRTFGSHRESRVEFSDIDIQMEWLLITAPSPTTDISPGLGPDWLRAVLWHNGARLFGLGAAPA